MLAAAQAPEDVVSLRAAQPAARNRGVELGACMAGANGAGGGVELSWVCRSTQALRLLIRHAAGVDHAIEAAEETVARALAGGVLGVCAHGSPSLSIQHVSVKSLCIIT